MTAEMFLAALLGCFLAFITFNVLYITVYIPLNEASCRQEGVGPDGGAGADGC
jgi:hypothetical protein